MALTTLQAVNDALPGQTLLWNANKGITGIFSGYWYSALTTTGGPPNQGVAPSSGLAGDVPTKATASTWNWVNPPAGKFTYLARAELLMGQQIPSLSVELYDRLWHNSGINATIATAQSFTPVAVTRPDALGDGVSVWFEVYAAMGAGTPSVSLLYTNQSGTANQLAGSGILTTAMALGRTQPFGLAAGDTGVRSVQTWQASGTFTSGTIGLVLRRRLASMVVPNPGRQVVLDAVALGLPRVYDDAYLEVLLHAGSTSTAIGPFTFNIVQG